MYQMSKPIFWEKTTKKNVINFLSAESVPRVVKGLNTLGRFYAIFLKGRQHYLLFAFQTPSSF